MEQYKAVLLGADLTELNALLNDGFSPSRELSAGNGQTILILYRYVSSNLENTLIANRGENIECAPVQTRRVMRV